MILLDENGYANTMDTTITDMACKMAINVVKRGVAPQDESSVAGLVQHYKNMIMNDKIPVPLESFADFVKSDFFVSLHRGMDEAAGQNEQAKTNHFLIYYHMYRFLEYGKIVYKIRPRMLERIKNITLDVPANLLVAPHKEFVISIPFGMIATNLGSLVNIYVSSEPFNVAHYSEGNGFFRTDGGVGAMVALKGASLKRNIRAMGIFYKKTDDPGGETAYYQLPIADDMNVQEIFDFMVNKIEFENKDSVRTVFNLVLNFCCYLCTKDPDIQKVLGIQYKPLPRCNPKKLRLAERNAHLYGYDYIDVGRIYDTRYTGGSYGLSGGKIILKRFTVRSHIRAQWYGPRSEGVPGTEQKLILIEEYEKGDDLQKLNPKIVEVG
jgi:hypothetical protein